jgi:hypothetical protein
VQIKLMNPKYTEFRFPQIKAHPWNRVFRARTEQAALDLVDVLLVYDPFTRVAAVDATKVRVRTRCGGVRGDGYAALVFRRAARRILRAAQRQAASSSGEMQYLLSLYCCDVVCA